MGLRHEITPDALVRSLRYTKLESANVVFGIDLGGLKTWRRVCPSKIPDVSMRVYPSAIVRPEYYKISFSIAASYMDSV